MGDWGGALKCLGENKRESYSESRFSYVCTYGYKHMYVDVLVCVYTYICAYVMTTERGRLEGGRGPRTDEEEQ